VWLLAHSICLPEQEAEFLPTSSSDIELLAQSKLKVIPEKFCSQDSLTEAYLHSLSGMMSPHFDQTTPQPQAISNGCEKGVGNSSSVAGSPNFAKTLAPQEKAQESTANDLACGRTWPESSARYDRVTHSWRTHQCLWDEALPESSVTLPKWGMARDGVVSPLPTLGRRTRESVFGFWATPTTMDRLPPKSPEALLREATIARPGRSKPANLRDQVSNAHRWPTPTVNGNYNRKGLSKTSGDGLATYVAKFPTPTKRSPPDCEAERRRNTPSIEAVVNVLEGTKGGRLNPEWVEWLMGWPIGATALSPLETDKFQEWQQQHGGCFLNDSTIEVK